MEVERNGAETVQAEDNGYVGSEDRSKAANDVPDIEQMDVGKDRNHMETSTPTIVQGSKMERTEVSELRSEAEVTSQSEIVGRSVACDSSDGDVVKSDSGDGVKVSNVDCGTGGEGVNSDGVKGAEGGGGGGGSAQSEQQKQLWAAVKANPSDFTSWTTLLQIVEQNYILDPAREAFSQFLQLYPYCYGYWKKYTDLVRKLCGDEEARKVLEEGVAAIPLSVDLWVHYATFATSVYSDSPQAEELIRSVYDRAVQHCGLDYRSAKIWDAYIDWESSAGRQRRVMALYNQLLAIPTKELQTHFEKFKKLLESTPTSQLLCEQEYQDVSSQSGDANQGEAMLDGYIRKVTLERRTAVFEKSMIELERRRQYETTIKRPYFHVKPLERAQLKNWRDYLDFEISEGNSERISVLFERCMIACALYEDFWSKYCKYAKVHMPKLASSIFRRACTVHLRQKPNIHVSWAAFEEETGNMDTAREILADIDRVVPGQVLVRLRRIGLEIRVGRYSEADALYQESLNATMSLEMRNFYAWRYARFTDKLMQDHSKAVSVMSSAIDLDPSNSRLYLQLLDLHTSGHAPPDMAAADALFERVANSESLSDEVKESFLQRRQQLLEEFGGSFSDLLEVTEKCERLKRLTRKRTFSEADSDSAKKVKMEPLAIAPPATTPVGVAPPLTPEQQWAAYQQQWGAYNYAQQPQGYSYQGYYPSYPFTQQPSS